MTRLHNQSPVLKHNGKRFQTPLKTGNDPSTPPLISALILNEVIEQAFTEIHLID
jgi:hypothetical protein